MRDLIDRGNLLTKILPWAEIKGYSDGELNMLKAIVYEIQHMPMAELTEDDVIRYCIPRRLVIMTYEYFHWLIRGKNNVE